MQRWLTRVPCLFTLFVAGCTETVESTDVRTTGIYPEFTVTADGSGNSTAEAQLKVGGSNSNTFLDLQGDDQLTVTANGTTKTLDKSDGVYQATFGTDDEGTEFVFAFTRGANDTSAPSSSVRLPAPFEMHVGTTQASRASEGVDLTWSPDASGDIDWTIDGECLFARSGATPDDGSYTLSNDQITAPEGEADQTCTASVVLQRTRSDGKIDLAFTEGGKISAVQTRKSSFVSTP